MKMIDSRLQDWMTNWISSLNIDDTSKKYILTRINSSTVTTNDILEIYSTYAPSISNKDRELIKFYLKLISADKNESNSKPADKNKIVSENEKHTYRTSKKSGKTDDIPPMIPAIINKKFQNAMSLVDDDTAYIQPLSLTSADNLVFENGQLYFEGMPATAATLKEYYTTSGIENLDLPLLRLFYAIILNRFATTWAEDRTVEQTITIYYPDLCKQLGMSSNTNESQKKDFINRILSFQTIMGVIDRGKRGEDILPVLVYLGNDNKKNTISFASPYMVRVIEDIYNASIRKTKENLPLLKKNGEPQLLPAYSYMIKPSITKEKNKKAVEIVFIVITTIAQSNTLNPSITAREIINKNLILKQSIDLCSSTPNKTLLLKRAFTKAWELLKTQTELTNIYKNIELPDITNYPTMSSLDMVFEFHHEGIMKEQNLT